MKKHNFIWIISMRVLYLIQNIGNLDLNYAYMNLNYLLKELRRI